MSHSNIILTDGQQEALDKFVSFLLSTTETVFVIEGYAGTGKSTLIKTLMERLSSYNDMVKMVQPDYKPLEVILTATTNKAAEAFAGISGYGVRTIHSHLSLRPFKNYGTGETKLVHKANTAVYDQLLFIDEASYIDQELLDLIFEQTVRCKIVFIGDRAQLAPVGSNYTPVFKGKFKGAMLTEVVRQAADNPIISLATNFRNTVNSREWTQFKPDGLNIVHMSRDAFDAAIVVEFTRPDWHCNDSKMLAWTNATVMKYNHAINVQVTGDPSFSVGDYAVNNSFVMCGKDTIKTDQTVLITDIGRDTEEYAVSGNYIELNDRYSVFFPKSLAARKARIKQAKTEGDLRLVELIENQWADLRSAYAQTVNKAQGSTYDTVFIDLDDISRCNSGDQIARMMYVAVSRARNKVILTGDFS